jgi:hypothetical protein
MCCSTGVCGPVVDPALPRFASDAAWLRARGVRVVRYNLATNPGAFARRDVVREAMEASGQGVLPMVVLGDAVLSRGSYPTREALATAVGLPGVGAR